MRIALCLIPLLLWLVIIHCSHMKSLMQSLVQDTPVSGSPSCVFHFNDYCVYVLAGLVVIYMRVKKIGRIGVEPLIHSVKHIIVFIVQLCPVVERRDTSAAPRVQFSVLCCSLPNARLVCPEEGATSITRTVYFVTNEFINAHTTKRENGKAHVHYYY